MLHHGLFISFEGPDGSGKSSVIKALNTWLKKYLQTHDTHYHGVFLTREPGGNQNQLCEELRHILFNPKYEMNPHTEALLLAAGRSSHVLDTINPQLNQQKIILADRYVDSSYVYQGFVNGLGFDWIYQLNHFATYGVYPHLTIILMVDAETGLSRIHTNPSRETNRIDHAGIEFHKQVENYYQQLPQLCPDRRYEIIDASHPLDDVVSDCKKVILKLIHEQD